MDAYIGEIRFFPFGFIPYGWYLCDGQKMPINENAALYSLIGTQFGGDGRIYFRLPNLTEGSPLNNTSNPMFGCYGINYDGIYPPRS